MDEIADADTLGRLANVEAELQRMFKLYLELQAEVRLMKYGVPTRSDL